MPFGFNGNISVMSRRAPQPHSLSSERGPWRVPIRVALASVRQSIAIATRKNRAAIEDCNPTPAPSGWAIETKLESPRPPLSAQFLSLELLRKTLWGLLGITNQN